MTRFSCRFLAALATGLLTTAAVPVLAEGPTTFQRLTNPEPQNWLLPHRTYNGWRYSELDQITPTNVGNLKLAFAFGLGSAPGGRAGEHQPLVDEGFMYVTNALNMVFKLDVRSGKRAVPLWSYDPAITPDVVNTLVTNRGVALLGNNAIINTVDGRVIAINRDTGDVVWEKQVGTPVVDAFTSQPLAVKDKVLVGQAKGDYENRGYIAALNGDTGQEAWRFYTIPGPGEPGHESWPANNDAWKMGGASIWAPGSYDVATNLLYYGTSNAAPAYDPESRAGDNLYTASLIVLNADTGKLQWYFQFEPGEGLEHDEITPYLLVDTMIGGQPRKVVAHHSVRGGFFYTLDRTNGGFIAAQKNAPSVNWTAGIDPKTGKPVEYDPTKTVQSYGGRNSLRAGFGNPGCQAASSWGGQAYNPTLNRVYSLIVDSCFDRKAAPPTAGYAINMNGKGYELAGQDRTPATPSLLAMKSTLVGPRVTATDVSTGMIVNYATAANENPNGNPQGGTLATKSGLVFAGHGDGTLTAYDANTMANLWSVNVGTPLRSPPITYSVGGKQFIAITGGGTGTGVLSVIQDTPTLWVFAL